MRFTKIAGAVGVILLIFLGMPAFAFTRPGTKALGMGGAFTAVADDPSCIFWNPAGVTQLGRFNLDASLSATGENVENFANLYELYKALLNMDYKAAEDLVGKISAPMSLEPTLNLEIAIARRFAISGAARTEVSIDKFEFNEGAIPPYVEIKDVETALTPIYLTYATGLPASAFKVGLNAKYIQGIRHSSHFTLLANGDTVEIDPEQTSNAQTATSFDLGVLYAPEDSKITYGLMVEDVFEPKVNFPDMTEPDLKFLTLSRKVNFGLAFKGIPRLTLAADVHDLTGNNKTFHIGGEMDLSLLKLRAGLDDGNLTYGLGLGLGSFGLEAAYSQRAKTPVVSVVLLRLGI